MGGAALIVLSYLLLQVERLSSDDLSYSVLNAVGASMILYSLCFDFNLAALLMEGFWVLISLFGIWRSLRSRRFPETASEEL